MNDYVFQKDYRDNKTLRKGYNELVKKTFALDFEGWFQNGYWSDKFNPYSLIDGDKVIANISVNQMDFDWNGVTKHYIQLGGVMTHKDYRMQGLSRRLMDIIISEYKDKVDGIFLLANKTVLDFYPKFGFRVCKEWQCSKALHNSSEKTAIQVPMKTKEDWKFFEEVVQKSVSNSAFEMKHNIGIIMFYITQFMQETVYYIKELDAYVVAEIKDSNLIVHQVYCDKKIDLDDVYKAFGPDVKTVTLNFTPFDAENYEQKEIQDEDSTLFMMGEIYEQFKDEKLMIPILSHT